MEQWKRWALWLTPPWGREIRRQQWLAVRSEQEDQEHIAACTRLLAEATRWR